MYIWHPFALAIKDSLFIKTLVKLLMTIALKWNWFGQVSTFASSPWRCIFKSNHPWNAFSVGFPEIAICKVKRNGHTNLFNLSFFVEGVCHKNPLCFCEIRHKKRTCRILSNYYRSEISPLCISIIPSPPNPGLEQAFVQELSFSFRPFIKCNLIQICSKVFIACLIVVTWWVKNWSNWPDLSPIWCSKILKHDLCKKNCPVRFSREYDTPKSPSYVQSEK